MGISLKWFKSEMEKELESLRIEEQKLRNQLLLKQLKSDSAEDDRFTPTKPYKSIKLVGDVLTVVLNDGSILSKGECNSLDFDVIRNLKSEGEIINLLACTQGSDVRKGEEDISVVSDDIEILLETGLFEELDFSIYLIGIERSLPPLLVNHFAHVVRRCNEEDVEVEEDAEFIALKRFFMWCCLNPRAEVANLLYDFLKKNRMKITRQGFFVALRNVVEVKGKKGNTSVVDFVSNAYNKVKGVWKKKPSDYTVCKSGKTEYKIVKSTEVAKDTDVVGNLETLYLDLPNMTENRFTDNWTHTFDIRIGKVVSMPKEDCNWSRQDCAAAGLVM